MIWLIMNAANCCPITYLHHSIKIFCGNNWHQSHDAARSQIHFQYIYSVTLFAVLWLNFLIHLYFGYVLSYGLIFFQMGTKLIFSCKQLQKFPDRVWGLKLRGIASRHDNFDIDGTDLIGFRK